MNSSDTPLKPRVRPGSFAIGHKRIGADEPVFVIAEVGVNHHGDRDLCARMVEAAAASGADAVKLQTINADESYVKGTASYAEFRDKALNASAMKELMVLAKRLGIVLFSTPGDFSSLDLMCELEMPAVKVSSGLLTNTPLISEAARRGLPMIISTGLAYENEIADAIDTALLAGSPGVAVLKCTALYPAPDDTINLRGIQSMSRRFGVPTGYSDHTLDSLACLSAVALGAVVIEKHFTLDKTRAGADHFISMEPHEFSQMVGQIRRLAAMQGNGRIVPAPAEQEARPQRHRCLVARMPVAVGEVLTSQNVALKRPLSGGVGLPPASYESVLGKNSLVALEVDQPIRGEDVADWV